MLRDALLSGGNVASSRILAGLFVEDVAVQVLQGALDQRLGAP